MKRQNVIVISWLFVTVINSMTSTSVGTTMKAIDTTPVLTTSPQGTTKLAKPDSATANPSVLPSNIDAKSQASSAANSTITSKPASDKKLISSIPTFDFSMASKDPAAPKVVNTCNTKDMCLQGFCVKGTCKTKKCSTDVVCVCDPGFTGQFCDKNITEVELKNGKNGKANGKTTTKTAASNKDLVNGHNNKELVNGHIDQTLLRENGNTGNGNYDNGSNGNGSGKNGKGNGGKGGENRGNGQKGINNENGKSDNGNGNGYYNKAYGSKENGKSKDKTKIVTDKMGKQNNHLQTKDRTNKNGKESSKNVANNEAKHVFSNKASSDKNSKKALPDGSYVKGPEVYVSTDRSSINVESTQKKIGIGDPKVIKERSNNVTMSTLAVERTRVGVVPELLTSGVSERLTSNVKTKGVIDTSISKQSEHSDKKGVSKNDVKASASVGKSKKLKETSTSKQKVREQKHMQSPQEKQSNLDVVSTVDIVNDKHVVVAEERGVVSIPNNTVGVSPLFANSEIKITIETSKIDTSKGNERSTSVSKGSKDSKQNEMGTTASDGATDLPNNLVDRNTQNGISQSVNDGEKPIDGTKPKYPKSKTKDNYPRKVKTTSRRKTTTKDQPSTGNTGASQNRESRKSMQSEILNPLIQLMNIIGSDKFADKVSAVKIEIITKQNRTTDNSNQKTISRESNTSKLTTLDNKIRPGPTHVSQKSDKETLQGTNTDSQNRDTTL